MQLRAERAELLTRYQPGSERIKQIDAKLASEEKILDNENHLEVNEQSTDVNPVWITLQTNLKTASTAASSGKATRDELNKQIDAANQQLASLVTNGVQMDRLQRQVTSDSDAYQAYVRKTEEARASEALNSNKILNVSVAQPPIVPLQPVVSECAVQPGRRTDPRDPVRSGGRLLGGRKRLEDLFVWRRERSYGASDRRNSERADVTAMYYRHFGLDGPPFRFTSSPTAVYLGAAHRECLAALEWGLLYDQCGFMVLLGETGTGKTTLVNTVLARRLPNLHLACVPNPRLSFQEILRVVLPQLGRSNRRTRQARIDSSARARGCKSPGGQSHRDHNR